MRSTKQTKIQKSGTRTKITKTKKTAHKSNRSWGFGNDVSIANLENINEILRARKTRRAENSGYWKLLPKDSCEVHKERRRKQLERQDQGCDCSDEGLNKQSMKRSKKIKTRRKELGKRVKKPLRKTRRIKRRPLRDSSMASCTSCSSMYCMFTSCASTSDMECEYNR